MTDAARTASPPRYSRTIEAAVLKLDELGIAELWTRFALIPTLRLRRHVNVFRHLRRYGLVEDLNEPLRAKWIEEGGSAERLWQRFPSRWQLTERGRACAAAIKGGNGGR